MPDPSQMSDEELDAAIIADDPNSPANGGGEPDEPTPPTPAQDPAPAPAEEPEPTPPVEEEPQVDPDEPTPPPSRREQLRLQDLLKKYGPPQQREQQQPSQQRPSQPRPDAIDYEQELDADPALIKRLNEDRARAEQARYDEGLRQAQGYEWRTLLQVDAPQMETKYPQLDKNSTEFHPAIADSLSTMYLQMSGFDERSGLPERPGMRWSDFVESFWELADEIGSLKSQATATRVAKQAATTGLRPDGSAVKLNLNKAPEQMSDEELDAYLGTQNLTPVKR